MARGGATARRRRCSSAAREQRLSPSTSISMPLETKRIIEAEGGICEAVARMTSLPWSISALPHYNNVGIVEVIGPVETSEESWDRVNT